MGSTSKFKDEEYFNNYLSLIQTGLSDEQYKSFMIVKDLYFYFLDLRKKVDFGHRDYNSIIINLLENYLDEYEPDSIFNDIIEICFLSKNIISDTNYFSFKMWKRKNKIKKWIQD